MDAKNWRWRKRSSEKTITAAEKVEDALNPHEGKVQAIPLEKDLGRNVSVKTLNEKLASVLVDCHEKDEIIVKHAKAAEEAAADSEKAEAKAELLKQELDDALSHVFAAKEESSRFETKLKECNDQLTALREDSDRMIHDAVFKRSREFVESQKILEEKLSESNKRLVAASLENTRLSAELLIKEKLIEDLSKSKSQVESEFNALMARLDSIEKENAFLKYEFCVLEKELAIRNEELEYNRQAADSSHKKHLESVKKIAKLEGECNQLRVLMQKRLPGPAAMAKIKSEVRMLGKEQTETRRRNPELSRDVRNSMGKKSIEVPSNKVNYLVEKLCGVEEENKTLKELLARKETELDFSRALCSETSLKLSELEARVAELSGGQGMELVKSDEDGNGNEIGTSSSGSWANALMSELEHFKNDKLNPAEMDKLAIVSVGPTSGIERGLKTVAVPEISFDWLQVVLNAMTEQTRISNRSLLDLFYDLSIALGFMNQSDQRMRMRKSSSPDLKISGYLTWKSPNTPNRSGCIEANLSQSVQRIIELIEAFTPTATDYFVRVFQWKSSELSEIQQKFLKACSDLLDEKSDVETFVGELAVALDWLMNGDSTPKSTSNVRDRIKKRLNWTEAPIKGELENVPEDQPPSPLDKNGPLLEDKTQPAKEDMELRLKSANDELEKAKHCIGSLRLELEDVKESKRRVEEQMENQKSINENLDTQLTMARAKLNEVFQKFSSLEVELEEKKSLCEELESTCLELQLQIESVAKETPKYHDQMLSQTGWEITAASVKLAECQETILSLGRQLKSLASPRESTFFEKVLSTTTPPTNSANKNLSKRSSLRDRMIADDGTKPRHVKSPEHKDQGDGQKLDVAHILVRSPESYSGSKHKHSTHNTIALAIVPSKKQNAFGLLRRLLLRRRSRNKSFSFK